MVNELRLAGMDLCDAVAVEERAHVEQQLGVVETNWSTVTDLYARKCVYLWKLHFSHFAQKFLVVAHILSFRSKDLIDAMDNAMEFHDLYSELLDWLVERESKVAEFTCSPGTSSADVKNEVLHI